MKKRLWTRAGLLTAVPLLAISAIGAPAGAESQWDGFWGPYEYGNQPELSAPVPPPEPLGTYDREDFDSDGVVNISDNCLLVPNADQKPAVRTGSPVGPKDMLGIAERWKAEHPNSRFRTDDQLGEACSGYNKNYLKTTKGLIESSDETKEKVFKFLGESGPMFGGDANPTKIPEEAPKGEGNMTPSLPMCSSMDKLAELPDWFITGDQKSGPAHMLAKMAPPQLFDCGKGAIPSAISDSAMEHWFWAGKRLYTNDEGGRITNRFVPGITEFPGFDQFIANGPMGKFANSMHPGLFPTGTGQVGLGNIFRGKSYVDGNESILMDWRGPGAALVGSMIAGDSGWLIYDECRAIQTGVYHCSAVLDIVVSAKDNKRFTWNEGYMPWVTKGPPSRQEYLEAIRSPF